MSKRSFDPSTLNKVIHSPIRLGVVSTLYTVSRESFTNLKKAVSATDGNFTTHIYTLAEHGIVKIKKMFVGKKPRTMVQLTKKGRKVFQDYVSQMATMVERFSSKKKRHNKTK